MCMFVFKMPIKFYYYYYYYLTEQRRSGQLTTFPLNFRSLKAVGLYEITGVNNKNCNIYQERYSIQAAMVC
jgi:hypothetical protein